MTSDRRTGRADDLSLPVPHLPVGTYRMVRRDGDTLHVSGHGAFEDGVPAHIGRLGETLATAEGAAAARAVMLHLLASVAAEVGDLSQVSFLKVVVLVSSTPDFTEQHLVADGATDLLVDALGEARGTPARTAIGVAALPLGFAVEIEALARVERAAPDEAPR